MKAMDISRDELAANLQMTLDELDALLTPTRDYTISEIRHLLGGVYLTSVLTLYRNDSYLKL